MKIKYLLNAVAIFAMSLLWLQAGQTEAQVAKQSSDYSYSPPKVHRIVACQAAMDGAASWKTRPVGSCDCNKDGTYWRCKVEKVAHNTTMDNFNVAHGFDLGSKDAACAKAKSGVSPRWAKTFGDCECGEASSGYICLIKTAPKNFSPKPRTGAVISE